MGLFKKRGNDVVDLSEMYKREQQKNSHTQHQETSPQVDTIDFSQNTQSPQSQPTQQTQSDSSSNNFDFLGNLAQASSTSSDPTQSSHQSQRFSEVPQRESPGPITSQLRQARQVSAGTHTQLHSDSHVNELKIKLDDNDYKLRDLVERIEKIEAKLRELNF